jgi:hypothetical protein
MSTEDEEIPTIPTYKVMPVSEFENAELEKQTNEDFEKVFTQVIDKKCINLMLDYTENYIRKYQAHPEIKYAKYIDIIIDDNRILKSLSKTSQRIFSMEELKEYGVTICTIKTGLQRLWIDGIQKEKVQSKTYIRKCKDFQKYGLIPGQHLFYYGAFTGPVTRSKSTATHHFIYLYNGIIMEVGTEKIEGCRDIDQPPPLRPPPALLEKVPTIVRPLAAGLVRAGDTLLDFSEKVRDLPQYLYKGAMSYFGFSTIQNSVRWAKKYGQTNFYVYEMTSDSDITVINNRLTRASSTIGKWPYSLLGSNNCENAANYIYVGQSKSTQACPLDTFAAITKSLHIPIEYTRTHEYDLRSRAELPACVRDDDVYVQRYLTDKGELCIGTLSRGLGILNPTCEIDPLYCDSCDKTGTVTKTKPRKVCKTSPKGFKIIKDVIKN